MTDHSDRPDAAAQPAEEQAAGLGESPLDLDVLSSLARRFAERRMFSEASELLRLALKLDPKNRGIQLSLAQVHQKASSNGHGDRSPGEIREEMRRNAIDAAHFFGLAALYEERGKRSQAAECLEIARSKSAVNPFIPKLNGKLLLRRRQFDLAAEELRMARRYNPFDREIAELLSSAEYECSNFKESLEAAIDAFLLLEDSDVEHSRVLKRRIRSLKHIENLDSRDLVQLFHTRRDQLQTDFDRLEWQRERFLRGAPDAAREIEDPKVSTVEAGRIELAGRLRQLNVWSTLSDEAVFQLTSTISRELHPRGSKIFTYGSESADIYVLEEGQVTIRRPTSYGTFDLGLLGGGDVFGEVSFISLSERAGDAEVTEDCSLLRIKARDLELMISDDPKFGLEIYTCFWRTLANTLRQASEQLRSFFSDPSTPPDWLKSRHGEHLAAGDVDVHHDTKLELFREQGLTGGELNALARFSAAKRFPDGTTLFHEGEKGEEMYIILEGKVMVSKFIPGGGEEALAIFKRGDFFGEMALLDGQPRSADAKVIGGPVTLIALDQNALQQIMSTDSRSALEFIKLLCRLICRRLAEIDEKVISWHIMSGPRTPGNDTKPISVPVL